MTTVNVSYTALADVEARIAHHLRTELAVAFTALESARLQLATANEQIDRLQIEVREVENKRMEAVQPVYDDPNERAALRGIIEERSRDMDKMAILSEALLGATNKFDDAETKRAHYDLKRFLGDLRAERKE